MDKKKIGLLIIVLFLIIGLGSFVFANPDNQENFEEGDIEERDGQGSDRDGSSSSDDDSSDEDETDSSNLLTDGSDNQLGNAVDNDNSRGNNLSGNGNDSTLSGGTGQTSGTEEIPTITDNTYADALKAVEQAESSLVQGDVDYAASLVDKVTNQSQKDELNKRLDAVRDIIDVTSLIERLEEMVANSTNRDGIVESIDYRDDEKIEELVTNLNNGTAKDNLASRLETVNKILNDSEGPVISGIRNDSFTRNDSVSLTISDDNEVTTTVMFNGNPVDYTDSFTEEGTYVVTAVDAAFNEKTLTFTIDRTKPVVGGVEDGKYYNTDVAVTIDDANPGTVHLHKNGELVKPYNAGDPITEEGTYTVVVTDKADNKSKEITFVIDKHVEEPKWVYILNLSDENNRKTIRNGQTLRVEVNFDEELTELPVLTIGNSQSTTFRECSETDYAKYICVADLTIDNTIANLEDGEIPFTITNIYDKAGNTITLDNANVTETKEYGQVTYDGSAPVVKSLGVTDINEYKDEVGKLYAKYGDTVRVLIYFDEKLGTEPTVKLGGKEFTATYRKASSTKDEAYYADIKLTEDMDLSDGILSFGVYGYADEIGNVGVNLTEKDVNMSAYPSVTIDNTLPVLNFNNGFITSGYTVEATDDNFAYMTVQYYDGRETETIESNTFTLDKEGDNTRYNIKAYDKAGNVSEYRDIYLDNAKPVVSGTAINGGEKVSVENNGTYQEVTLNISDGSLKKVSLVKEDGTEEVLETYKDNFKNTKITFEKKYAEEGTYTFKAVDRNNNESTITFTIDKTPATRVYSTLDFDKSGKQYYEVDKEKVYYVKNGDSFVFRMQFSEALKTAPTVEVGGMKVPMTLNEKILNNEGKYTYEGTVNITEEAKLSQGRLEIVLSNVVDMAGNESTDEVVLNQTPTSNSRVAIYDKTVPSATKVQIINNSNPNSDYIKNGETVRVRVTFSEKLTTAPVLTIGNYTATFENVGDGKGNDLYSADITIKEDESELKEGKVAFTITGYTDLAGNPGDKITESSVKSNITYDRTAPVYRSLGIYGGEQHNNAWYVTNGDKVYINVHFNEKLAVSPYVKVNGKDVFQYGNPVEKETDAGEKYYIYSKVYKVNETDGKLSFEIYGYADAAGNIGKTLTATDTKIGAQNGNIIVDNTIPVLNFNNGFITSGYTVEATDDNFAYMTVQYYDGRETETIESNTFTLDKEGDNTRYNIKAYDKAGNVSEYRDIYLDNAKPVVSGTAINGGEKVSVENNGTYQEVTLNISDGSLKKVSLVKEDGTEEVLETYKDNFKNTKITFEKKYAEEGTYTFKAVDRNNNESTITFTIDKTPATRVYSTLDFDKSGKQYYEVDKEKVYYVKNGDSFVFRMQFSEALKTAPTVEVGGMKVPMTLNEKILNNEGKYTYEGTVNITEEAKLSQGRLEIVLSNVVDMAGNESTDEVVLNQTPTSNSRVAIYDKTVPSATKVQIINNSNPNSDYIKNGETVRVRVTFSEKLTTAPVLTIGNYTATFENVGDGKGNDLYSADITIKEDESELKEGKVAFTITGYTDLAGNPGDKITESSVKSNITYDRTAPVYRSLGIYGGEQHNNAWYVTNGDKVYINVHFNEKLAVSPYVKVNGKDVFQYGAPVEKETDDGEKYYIYSKVYKVNDTDGKLSFEIYGYADASGNIGKTLTANDTKIGAQNGNIIVDNTNPIVSIGGTTGEKYWFTEQTFDVTVTDANLDSVYYAWNQSSNDKNMHNILDSDKAVKVDSKDIIDNGDGTYTVKITINTEGRYVLNVKAVDKAGNTTYTRKGWYQIDKTEPTIVLHKNSNEDEITPGIHNYCVTATVSDDHMKSVKLNDADYESDTYICDDGNYTLTATDIAGNPKTINFQIDRTAPVISINGENFTGEKNDYKFYNEVNLSVIEDNEYTAWVNGKEVNISEYDFNKDGEYKVKVRDNAGTNTIVEFTVDTIPATKVELRVNSSNDNNQFAKIGDSFGIYLTVDEELRENPIFTVNGKEYKVNETETVNSGYKYAVVYKVTEDMEEGEIEFTISNIYDKAGNPLNDLSNSDANGKVIIDKTAPTATITYNTVDPTNHSVIATLTASEEVRILNAGTWNPEEGYGLVFKKSYPENNTQTVTIEDRAGNQNTVEVVINNIDKEAPSIGDLESDKEYKGSIPYDMSDNSGAFTLYYSFGTNYQTCEELMADPVANANKIPVIGSYKDTYPVPGNYSGVSVCLVDAAGNTTFRNNITITQ